MWRFGGWLWEVVSCENWSTEGFNLEEVWTHLHFRAEFITCNFLSYNICSFMLSLEILHILWVVYRAVNPLSLQILRMGRWCHNAQPMMSFLQKCAKKMLLELQHLTWLVYLPPITLLLILFQWYTEVYEKTFNVSKIAQTTQTMWNNISLSESQVYKKWQTSVIIWEIQSQVSTLERFPNQKGTNNMKFGVWGAHGVFVIERSSPLGKVWLY